SLEGRGVGKRVDDLLVGGDGHLRVLSAGGGEPAAVAGHADLTPALAGHGHAPRRRLVQGKWAVPSPAGTNPSRPLPSDRRLIRRPPAAPRRPTGCARRSGD